MIEVASLHIHPLKSGRAIDLEVMPIDRLGPVSDRRWMVIDPDGYLVTQREIPTLCHIVATPISGGLRLEMPGRGSIEVAEPGAPAERLTVTVWNDQVTAADPGAEAHRWIETALEAPVRLVHFPETTFRRTDPHYDPIGAPVSFADGFPLLLIGQASLDDLNARLSTPLPMNRFRPNVVAKGSGSFAEDGWKRIRIGGIDFDVVKPCARCVVTTTDQVTAERSVEPLRTLATFRKRGSGVMFGMNVVHRGTGKIAVGDSIEIVK